MQTLTKGLTLLLLCALWSCSRDRPESGEIPQADSTTTKEIPASYNTLPITTEGVGAFRVGGLIPTDPADGYSLDESDRTRYTEEGPDPETITTVSREGRDILELIHSNDKPGRIQEIIVLSNDALTASGIGVGSPIDTFIHIYPRYDLWYTYVSDRYILETANLPGVQFLLDVRDYKGTPEVRSEMTLLKPEDFVEGAEIRQVRIYGSM